ncbi:hypothetical protein QFZ49_001523 [Streptomyces turgidiscabies]|uniref:Secreted protein n=1 Tax=Streptomyces turgidiscabies TaxID=85558 RepID=A0ABU0RHZ7_9ACTN|nr:hypothetical protein [Streptomyces turgidiscabies]
MSLSTFRTASSRFSVRRGARSASVSACFWSVARCWSSRSRSPFWSATRVLTSSATVATSAAAFLAFFRSAHAASGSTAVSQRAR